MTLDTDKQRTLRDMIRRISPPWLQLENAYRLTYTLGFIADSILDSGYAALRLKMPGAYDYSTLALIGQERKLRRGLTETDEGYALRLRRWWAAARGRGNPYELIQQLRAYNPPGTGIEVIYRSGRRFSLNSSGEVVIDDLTGWNPDSTPELWATYTIILNTDIYHSLTGAEQARALQDLKAMVVDLNAGHCHGRIDIMASDSNLWSALPPPPGDPDLSTWADSDTWAASGQDSLMVSF